MPSAVTSDLCILPFVLLGSVFYVDTLIALSRELAFLTRAAAVGAWAVMVFENCLDPLAYEVWLSGE